MLHVFTQPTKCLCNWGCFVNKSNPCCLITPNIEPTSSWWLLLFTFANLKIEKNNILKCFYLRACVSAACAFVRPMHRMSFHSRTLQNEPTPSADCSNPDVMTFQSGFTGMAMQGYRCMNLSWDLMTSIKLASYLLSLFRLCWFECTSGPASTLCGVYMYALMDGGLFFSAF